MSIDVCNRTINSHISAYAGYENSKGEDIRLKLNKKGEVVFVIENEDVRNSFTFLKEDKDFLDRFHILMNNVLVYKSHNSNSSKGIKVSTVDIKSSKEFSLELLSDNSIKITIFNLNNGSQVSFNFSTNEDDILNRFKKSLNEVVREVSDMKLPIHSEVGCDS